MAVWIGDQGGHDWRSAGVGLARLVDGDRQQFHGLLELERDGGCDQFYVKQAMVSGGPTRWWPV